MLGSIVLGNDFMDMQPKAQAAKTKTSESEYTGVGKSRFTVVSGVLLS